MMPVDSKGEMEGQERIPCPILTNFPGQLFVGGAMVSPPAGANTNNNKELATDGDVQAAAQIAHHSLACIGGGVNDGPERPRRKPLQCAIKEEQ